MKKIKSVWEDMPRKSSEMESDDMKVSKIKAAPEVTVIKITPSEMDMPKKIDSSEVKLEKIKAAPKAERVGGSAKVNRFKSIEDLKLRVAELEKLIPAKEEAATKKESNSKKTNMFDRNIEQEK